MWHMKFNLNRNCSVVLTAYGAEILNQTYACIVREYKEGDVFKTQVWTLFNIFGEAVHIGNPQISFKDFMITLLDE